MFFLTLSDAIKMTKKLFLGEIARLSLAEEGSVTASEPLSKAYKGLFLAYLRAILKCMKPAIEYS